MEKAKKYPVTFYIVYNSIYTELTTFAILKNYYTMKSTRCIGDSHHDEHDEYGLLGCNCRTKLRYNQEYHSLHNKINI
jgi:hypothetical protein